MAEQMAASTDKTPENSSEKMGCGGKIGLLLLIVAICAVLFILIFKPYLEEKGVDVDGRWESVVEKASDVAGSLQEKGAEGVEKLKNAASEANEKGRDLSEKADDAWMKAAENADAGKEKIQESLDSWY